jgi:hypothetical protein
LWQRLTRGLMAAPSTGVVRVGVVAGLCSTSGAYQIASI